MSKHYYILNIAIRNLFNNKFRTLAVIIPLSLIIALVSAFSFCLEGIKKDALLAVDFFPDILLQHQKGGRPTESLMFDTYSEALGDIKYVKSFFPRKWGYINYTGENYDTESFVVMGLDPEFINDGKLMDFSMEKGRALKKSDTSQGIMGKALARALKCDIGDTVLINSLDLDSKIPVEVVGIFDSSVQIYTADLLLVNLDTAGKILGFSDSNEVSDILIYLVNSNYANYVAYNITKLVEETRPLSRADMIELTERVFGQRSGFFYLLWLIMLANIIIIAWSLLSQISFSMQKEIGILKAIGWDTGDIMELKTVETILISSFSVLTGILCGIVYMLADAPGLKHFIIGWTDIYPEFPIPLYIDATTIFLIAILGIIPLLAGTVIPVWKLGIVDPDEAVRK